VTAESALPAHSASQVLLAQIEALGISTHQLSAQQAWTVFLNFAKMPFDVPQVPNSDGLLYQFGTFHFAGEPAFYLEPVRQLARHDSDEYIQVHLEMQFPPHPDVAALGQHTEWWFPNGSIALTDWAQAISRRPEWHILNRLPPTRVDIYQDET
jgi:hypothetical protein